MNNGDGGSGGKNLKLVKRVYKYATGEAIPEGAVYLNTIAQTKETNDDSWHDCWLVWHYFLVEVEE